MEPSARVPAIAPDTVAALSTGVDEAADHMLWAWLYIGMTLPQLLLVWAAAVILLYTAALWRCGCLGCPRRAGAARHTSKECQSQTTYTSIRGAATPRFQALAEWQHGCWP